MRTAFIEELVNRAKEDLRIFLVVGDLGFSVVEPFRDLFPDRFLNVGVAEQNMTGVAAGLAMQGFKVFTYSIANFPSLRSIEQIRYDVCYHNLDVTIVSVGAGYAYGSLGVSHHATEDMAMLRAIPNMHVCSPSDPIETRAITGMICSDRVGPNYLRLGKAGEKIVHSSDISMVWGDIIEIIEGYGTAIIGCGSIISQVMEELKNAQSRYGLYSAPFVSDLDQKKLAYIGSKYQNIITIEEHQQKGGFGSAILEAYNILVNKKVISKMPPIECKAINNEFISCSGSQTYLRSKAGLELKF